MGVFIYFFAIHNLKWFLSRSSHPQSALDVTEIEYPLRITVCTPKGGSSGADGYDLTFSLATDRRLRWSQGGIFLCIASHQDRILCACDGVCPERWLLRSHPDN